jgi:hypothetical protein
MRPPPLAVAKRIFDQGLSVPLGRLFRYPTPEAGGLADGLGNQPDRLVVGDSGQHRVIALVQGICQEPEAGRIPRFLAAGHPEERGHLAVKGFGKQQFGAQRPALRKHDDNRAGLKPNRGAPAEALDERACRVDKLGVPAPDGFLQQRPVAVLNHRTVFHREWLTGLEKRIKTDC